MRALLVAVTVVLAGCTLGSSVPDLGGERAAGADAEVRRAQGEPLTGELLGWTGEGLILVIAGSGAGRLILVPSPQIDEIRLRRQRRFGGPEVRTGDGEIRYAARFPYRIDDALLERLLAAYQQRALERAR